MGSPPKRRSRDSHSQGFTTSPQPVRHRTRQALAVSSRVKEPISSPTSRTASRLVAGISTPSSTSAVRMVPKAPNSSAFSAVQGQQPLRWFRVRAAATTTMARKPTPIPNSTHRKGTVRVMAPVTCRNAAMMPANTLTTTATPVQFVLQLQLNSPMFFTSHPIYTPEEREGAEFPCNRGGNMP